MEAHEINRRRTALGLSQAALARELGVDRATVHRWEAGTSRPRGAALTGLAMTFARLERNQANRIRRRRARPAQPDR
jgi:DNA-binding transcriptional regulator YiaG